MSRYFSRKERVFLSHLRFDQRVSGIPPNRAASHLFDFLGQSHGAFYFADCNSSRVLGEDFSPVESHESVSPNDIALVVHNSYSVGVSVKADAQISSRLKNFFYQLGQIFSLCRIGMVVGESSVGFAEKFCHIASYAAQKFRSVKSSRAVARVAYNLRTARSQSYL